MIKIESKKFGKLEIPKEGFDKQSLLEKFFDGIRDRDEEVKSEDGEKILPDKHNRIVCEEAMKVGWIAPFDPSEEPPKKVTWIADGIAKYVSDCITVDPS